MENNTIEFLLRAKRATYAGGGVEVEPSRLASHDLQYSEGDLKYIDTYLGSAKFSGEEAVWKDGVPFWSMNYIGRVVADGFSGDFLKDALSQGTKELPYRGPLRYESEDYLYVCSVKGDFNWFYGHEEIFFGSKKVYECLFHGGNVD